MADSDMNEILFGASTEDDCTDSTTSNRKPDADEVLAALALSFVLDKRTRRRLADRTVTTIVVGVPDAGWARPIYEAIDGLVDGVVHDVVRTESPKPQLRIDTDLPFRMRAGQTVIGVSQDPDRCLPPLLLSTTQIRIAIHRPDTKMIARVIRLCQRGRVPARLHELNIDALTFDEITSVIVPDGHAAATVDRLAAAIEAKLKVGPRPSYLPRLEDAIEYGAARAWALDLRTDIADARAGRIDWDQVDKGLVLYGPPGTGKTLFARMLGESCGIPTVLGSIGQLFAGTTGHLDAVIKAQRKLFDDAKDQAPSLLFLDELNALPSIDTVSQRNKDYWAPVITDFYTLLDGAMSDRSGVIVIGATNRIQDINPALLRPGRLERAIEIGPPDAAGIERIMRHHLAGDLPNDDLHILARLNALRQATGAVVMEQVRAARRRARRSDRALAFEDIEAQVLEQDDRTPDELKRVAIHEAGHAVALSVLGFGTPRFVTILKNGLTGGLTGFRETAAKYQTREDYENLAIMMLAGRAAEHVVLDKPSHGAGGHPESDLGRVTRLLATMFAGTGLGDSLTFLGAEDDVASLMRLDRDFRQRVEKAIAGLYDRAYHLMHRHRGDVVAIANALADTPFIEGDEIESLLGKRESMAA